MKFRNSIAFRISVASGAALAITVALLTMVGALNVRRQAVDAFEQSSRARIQQADESLDGLFKEVEQNLTYLARTAQLQSADNTLVDYMTHSDTMTPESNGPVERAIFALLKAFGDSHPNMRYLDMGTKWGGYVQWPIESFNGAHYDPRVRPWYQLAMTAPDKVVRPAPYLNASSAGGAIISFASAVKNPQGEVIGVLEGDITLDGFAKLTNGIRFGQTGYLIVVDNNGKILVDPRDKSHEFKEMKGLGDGYQQLAAAADGLATVDMNGASYQAFTYTSPRNGWKYYALIPNAEMMAAANRLTATLIGVGLLVLAVALAITVALGRKMTTPLRKLAGSMYEIASGDGDMTRRLPAQSSDEVGHLATQFNAFVEKLHGVLVKVMASSRHFELAAGEVSAGNGDLSARTEQQAASIQQTAATMEQLASTVRDTARQAKDVNEVATTAVDVARRGNEAVSTASRTMDAAVEQSARIVGIVAMIEGIAFQTNILALNAAVESARAGESGRGFAVVASEVRNLAQRSTTAAKEIKDLLESSVDNVRTGAEQVSLAGRTIAELTDAIANVASITTDISASALEQSRSIDEINQAVSLMDRSTQQNAALVEEIAAASESLSSQGRELHTTVGFFKLD
ncbi:methyl-accepting chemotaxis protein [Trinickia caryophylli]|uniref:methyl-accepting chemotaxis protein n=1 Tax=Trinickia caryophylli TaxID=28094 RepID=UPI000A14BB2D|nr:methyl-accepting chemotaxis protein [Trinickia caryophylli]PMS11466.1 methyl-accepting chemotaxis protein [Trinickia caryophylli]TRX17532.1 methyl-accepting chemotaxis protein [Trinickia caryophylli]WQE11719.1 methyl-accepting chemotaxis protein [Trinickia caryophylli]